MNNSIHRAPLAFAGIAVMALMWATPSTAHAGDCSDFSQVSQAALKVLKGVCEVAKGKFDCTKILKNTDKIEELSKKWDEEFKDSKFKIGPRSYTFNKKVDGTLIAGTKRTWISIYAVTGDKATVLVNKQGGKAADITICTIDADGIRTKAGQISFAANTKDGTEKSFTVKNAEGQIVLVKLDARKQNKFKYQLTVKAAE